MNLIEKTATELLVLQASGQATATQIAAAFLAAAKQREPKVKAFLQLDDATVLAQAMP